MAKEYRPYWAVFASFRILLCCYDLIDSGAILENTVVKIISFICFLSLLMASIAEASRPDDDEFRASVGLSFSASEYDGTSSGETETQYTEAPVLMQYQSKKGWLAEIGHTYLNMESFHINGLRVDTAGDNSISQIGLGYRTAGSTLGKHQHWGVSITRLKFEGKESPRTRATIFSEKDSQKKYGRIGLSYEEGDGADKLTLDGKHVWFITHSLGLGAVWSMSCGHADMVTGESESYKSAALGAIVMWRF